MPGCALDIRIVVAELAEGKCGTEGSHLADTTWIFGLMVQSGFGLPLPGFEAPVRVGDGTTLVTLKLLTLLIFLLVTGPASTHALVKAAYARGVRWGQSNSTADTPDSEHAHSD